MAKHLKRKHKHTSLKLSTLKRKFQNMGSSTGSSVSFLVVLVGSSNKPSPISRVTQLSSSTFKGKAHMSFDPIDLMGNTNIQEGSVKFEISRIGTFRPT